MTISQRVTLGFALALFVVSGWKVAAQERALSPSDSPASQAARSAAPTRAVQPDLVDVPTPAVDSQVRRVSRQDLLASLTIFVLAVFVGFEIIAKVPPTLHTPLMSGSNAISGITLVGAVVVAGFGYYFSTFLGFIAVILATINVVGGFLVTHRMLAMFKKS